MDATASSPGSTSASSPQSCASETTGADKLTQSGTSATPPPIMHPISSSNQVPSSPVTTPVKPEQMTDRWGAKSPQQTFHLGFHSPTSPHTNPILTSPDGLSSFGAPPMQTTIPYSSSTVPLNVMGHPSPFANTYPQSLSRYPSHPSQC